MALSPEASALAKTIRGAGIKSGHAYDIASGRRRPSAKLAVELYRAAGLRLGPVAGLSDEEIAVLEKVHG